MVKFDYRFEGAFKSYLDIKELNKKTKDKYLFFYNKMRNIYQDFNQKNVDTFLSHNINSPARSMIKNLISAIKRWDFPKEIKDDVSNIDIPQITGKKKKVVVKFIIKSDVERLALGINTGDYFTDERIRLMILVQFYAGLRISELMGLTYDSLQKDKFDDSKKYQSITISSESAKFGQERFAYIPTHIYKRLLKWLKISTIQGKIKKIGDVLTLWGIGSSRYKVLLDKWTREILGEHYNSHSLRHGRGHDLRNVEGKELDFVKGYLGHADIKSTQIYTHTGDKEIKDELEK